MMDWKAFGQKIGLPTDGAMGDYYRPQIEQAMQQEAARAAQLGNQPGFQANDALQGGNSTGSLMQQTNAAAGRTPQAQNPYMPSEGPTMYAGGSKTFNESGGGSPTHPVFGNSGSFQQGSPSAQQQTGQPWSQNPYMQPMFSSIMSQNTDNFKQNVFPQLGRNAVASGGYGGSRQGIAEGLAMQGLGKANTDAMANIGFQGYQFDKNYGLQNDALNLNVYNANQNWMNQGQQNQLNAMDKLLGWNQTYGVGNATNTQNAPLNYWQQISGTATGLGGMGGTNSQNMQGNPWLSALGGALTGGQLYNTYFGGR